MNYPIGIQSFEKVIGEGYVYVDKTALIAKLIGSGEVYFMSRPRRFGKSLLISTLANIFRGRRELFAGLDIDSMPFEWAEHPVLHLDFNGSEYVKEGVLETRIDKQLSSWEKQYGVRPRAGLDFGSRFIDVIEAAHAQAGRRVVILIDEYDKPILDVIGGDDYLINFQGRRITLEERHRDILGAFYSVLKATDSHLRFVFITGVTKFSQVSVFSCLNQLNDISRDAAFDALCGITLDELDRYFAQPIADMARAWNLSPEQLRQRLIDNYDGYHFSESDRAIINPYSLLCALQKGKISDFWFSTGTPAYLIRLLRSSGEDIMSLTGRYYSPNLFEDYRATAQRPLPMIYQSGYLTIKNYRRDRDTYLLDYPNDEVRRGFLSLVADEFMKKEEGETQNLAQTAVDLLEHGDTERFRATLTSFLAEIPYTMRRKSDERERERYFQYTFYLLLKILSTYSVSLEVMQSQGRVDCIAECGQHVYIFEFKLDGSASDALEQIDEKGYARPYASDRRTIHRIGVNFSSDTGTISDWQEE